MIIFFSGDNCYLSGGKQFVIKLQKFMVDDLAREGDEGRGKLR